MGVQTCDRGGDGVIESLCCAPRGGSGRGDAEAEQQRDPELRGARGAAFRGGRQAVLCERVELVLADDAGGGGEH